MSGSVLVPLSRKRLGFLLPLLLLFGSCGEAETPKPCFLWTVEKEGTQAWLFGTMHVSDPKVTTLASEVEEAFDRAQALYTEIEATPALGAQMAEAGTLPPGETLRQVLPTDLYARLERYVQSRRLDMHLFAQFRPWMVGLTLTQLDVMPHMAQGEALDVMLMKRAQMEGKDYGAVETIEEQLATLTTGTRADHIHMLDVALTKLLEEQRSGVIGFELLLAHYLSGDADALWQFALAETDLTDPVQVQGWNALLIDRNLRMAQRVDRILKESPDRPTMFAFGALHFLGPESVGAHLQAMGYTVTRVVAEE
ncbi:MAG: TraB/GumN family protein [Planctomycetota bacterium]|jgi:uncharacterized protein YbaP (TraB family)